MSDNRIAINQTELLLKANHLIQAHEDYIQGMHASTVEQKNDVLVFGGEYFLDSNGLPTAKSTQAFNMFKYLAHELSDKFKLDK